MEIQWNDLVPHLMRPPGDGIPTYSAGKGAAASLQNLLYSRLFTDFIPEQVDGAWRKTWEWLPQAQIVLLGIPSDTGAGIRRGAAYGPRGVREELYRMREFQKLAKSKAVVDLGDIYVNPHLLHDSMLSEEQKEKCRVEMYPRAAAAFRAELPVSALSQLKAVVAALTARFPHLSLQLIGGDHSVAWPMSEVLSQRYPGTLGIVQSDAHTDLLASRLGVPYCFGTWSFHANQLLGGGERMVQVGIRQSGRERGHWEGTTGVKQYWASEILARSANEVIDEIVNHLKKRGIRHLYFSNDIDGTDEAEAPATGTPAPEGLSSEFLFRLMERLGREFELVANDIVEVAPDLGRNKKDSRRTCKLAAKYLLTGMRAQLKSSA